MRSRAVIRHGHIAILLMVVGACSATDLANRLSGESVEEPRTDNPLAAGLDSTDLQHILEQRYAERLAAKPRNEIRGQVTDVDDQPLAGVTVRAANYVTTTDERGQFALSEVEYGRYVVSLEHPAYVFSQHVIAADYGTDPYVSAHLLPRQASQAFDADEATEVVEGPLALTFEPGDLIFADTGMPVHGKVDIVASSIEPGRKGHIEAAPAKLEGLNPDGSMTALESLGMLEVELTQNGRHLQVRPGESVGVRMKVPAHANVVEGSAVPMWHHDTRLGIWVREGDLQANVHEQDGNLVTAVELPHFSAWNFDLEKRSICVKMKVPGALAFRSVSTTATGAWDQYWMITGECKNNGRCVTNAPSAWSTAAEVLFKFQVQMQVSATGPTVWCDVPVTMLGGASSTVINGDNLDKWSHSLDVAAPTDNYCGTEPTYNATGQITATGAYDDVYVNQKFAVPLFAFDVNNNGNIIDDLNCDTAQPQISLIDPGFGKMGQNAKSSVATIYKDADRDSINDTIDKCPASSNNQSCNVGLCYVPPGPGAADWDYDLDTVDDFCDTKMFVYNPSQYNGL